MTGNSGKSDPGRIAITASLIVAVLMLAGKMTAWRITGSAAIFSDAMESVVHLFATGIAAFSLWYSLRPADRSHPYGHGKIAYFSSGFEGALIMIAAGAILYAAIMDLIRGPVIEALGIGLIITSGLGFINLILGVVLVRVGRQQNRLVLIANGKHVLTDMWTSLGVVVGLVLVWLTGLVWLDPVVAILVGLNILWTAGRLMNQAFSGLMELADPEDTGTIRIVLDRAVADRTIMGYHQLRHRKVNDQLWVEYHLLFRDDLPVHDAHARSHRVEDELHKEFGDRMVVVTAHLEPEQHDDAHRGSVQEPGDALL